MTDPVARLLETYAEGLEGQPHEAPNINRLEQRVRSSLRERAASRKRTVLKLYRATRDPGRHFASFAPALRQLDVPVCVLWGEGDPYLPVVFAERQRETFRNAEVHVLKGLGHWPFIDDPEAVRAHLLPFLQRALASDAQREQGQYVQS